MATLGKYTLDISGMEEAGKEKRDERTIRITKFADMFFERIKQAMTEKRTVYSITFGMSDWIDVNEMNSAAELIRTDNPQLSIRMEPLGPYKSEITFLVSLCEN